MSAPDPIEPVTSESRTSAGTEERFAWSSSVVWYDAIVRRPASISTATALADASLAGVRRMPWCATWTAATTAAGAGCAAGATPGAP